MSKTLPQLLIDSYRFLTEWASFFRLNPILGHGALLVSGVKNLDNCESDQGVEGGIEHEGAVRQIVHGRLEGSDCQDGSIESIAPIASDTDFVQVDDHRQRANHGHQCLENDCLQ